jgi:two-component system OmpR family response regulator
MQILLVEDDPSLADGMVSALKREGFVVNHVATGELAYSSVSTEPPDIVILDLGLPDMDGLEVLKKIRRKNKNVQVLILTAREALEDKITGLDTGADDYLTKPFEPKELMARLRVLERRLGIASNSTIVIGAVTLDMASHVVMLDGEMLTLSKREYMLLKALMERAGSILTRENLETKLYSWGEELLSNAIDVHIHNLRKKLPDRFIQTVRGMGYMVKKS